MKRSLLITTFILILTTVLSANGSTEQNGGVASEVTINLLIGQPRFREQYEAIFTKFSIKYKEETGISVKYELEMPPSDKSAEILKTRLISGSDLDIFAFLAVSEGPAFNTAGYLEDLTDQPWVDDLYSTVRDAVTIDGIVRGLPLESLMWGYLYNKDLYHELGLKPAMTISELKVNAKAIESVGKTPFLISYNEYWIPQLFLPLTVGAFASTTYPNFIEEMYLGNTSFSEFGNIFNIIDLVHSYANKDGLEVGGLDGCNDFGSGDYGMWIQGPWYSATILEAHPDFNIGVAPLPVSEDPSQTLINSSVSTTLGVTTSSKHKDIAKAMIAYLLSEEASSAFFKSVKFNPLSKVHTFDPDPWIKEASSYLANGKSYVDLPIPQVVKDESGKSLQTYYLGDTSQKDILKALDDTWFKYNKISNQN